MINKIKKWFGIHVHEWSKWELKKSNRLYKPSRYSNEIKYVRTTQERTCILCGYKEEEEYDGIKIG